MGSQFQNFLFMVSQLHCYGPLTEADHSGRKVRWKKRGASPRQLGRRWRNVRRFQSQDVAFKGAVPAVYLSRFYNSQQSIRTLSLLIEPGTALSLEKPFWTHLLEVLLPQAHLNPIKLTITMCVFFFTAVADMSPISCFYHQDTNYTCCLSLVQTAIVLLSV